MKKATSKKPVVSFANRVYNEAARIPKGKVMTYGQLAQLAGNPDAARAVGALMRTNPDKSVIPCHRVVSATGALTGYTFGKGVATKKSMLKKEGVVFRGERVDLAMSQVNKGPRK